MARAKGRRSNRRQQTAGTAHVAGTAAAASVRGVIPLRPPRLGAIALAILAVAIAFGGAIAGPFQFDDVASIPRNTTIERLWPPSAPLHPPLRASVSGRPAVNYSLAINDAINRAFGVSASGPYAPVGYRIANILIHLLSGLLLFGVIRRTARLDTVGKWSLAPDTLAAVVTAIWLVHPLQTEAVDYVIQRTELLVSFCYLATLYASIRAWDAGTKRSSVGWSAASVAACFVGMASKEVMASAPLTVMLYDRAFRATSWRELLRRPERRWLYAGLFATMALLVASILSGARADSVGFGHGMAWYEYLYSQAWAILRYLQLALWPDRLVFDYGANPIRGLRGIPGVIVLSAAAIMTVVAWKRAPWMAFLGTWFFMLLAPSSSVVPIQTEVAAERRVYLALVPVLILTVVALETVRKRLATEAGPRRSRVLAVFLVVLGIAYFLSSGWTGALVAFAFGPATSNAIIAIAVRAVAAAIACLIGWQFVTAQNQRPLFAALLVALTLRAGVRSHTYADAEALWRDTAAKIPDNPRAYDNLAAAIIQKDSSRVGEAEQALRRALALDSTYLTAWTNLADVELRRGRTPEGRALLEHALAINPDFVDANERLGGVLVKLGESQRAISYLERATSFRPNDESLGTLAIAYLALGRRDEAKTALLKAVAINPRRADALGYLGAMFAEEGRPGDALGYVEAAIKAGSTTPASYALLSYTYAQLQRPDDAARAASVAATSAGDNATIFLQLAAAMTIAQRPVDVERYLDRAVELEPRNPESITRLGLAKAENGKMPEAAALFRRALNVQPGYEPAQRALARVPGAPQRQ